MKQKDCRDDKEHDHKNEQIGIVWASDQEEARILVVAKWSNLDSFRNMNVREAASLVIHFKCKHSVLIGEFKLCFQVASNTSHIDANIGIKHHCFELNISRKISLPFAAYFPLQM